MNIQPKPTNAARAVIDPLGRRHPSIASAAAANDRRPSSVNAAVRIGRGGWRFAEAGEMPVAENLKP